MRVVFFGTPELAVPSLRETASRHEVTAVVCQPDRPKGRSNKPQPPPTKQWAESHGVSVHQPVKLNDGAFEAWLRSQRPDACALAAYGRILKQPILDVPKHGFLNMHPSLLPKYRGPSPIQSAIIEGERETGVTIIRLSAEMDAGDILMQTTVPISDEDDGVTLSERLGSIGGLLLADALDRVAAGNAHFKPQDDSAATYCTMLMKSDGLIRWEQPARTIHNLVRGTLPWPIAQAQLHGEHYRIYRTRIVEETANAAPGTIVRIEKDRLAVATGDRLLDILQIQPPAKRVMDIGDFLRGHSIELGERFEEPAS